MTMPHFIDATTTALRLSVLTAMGISASTLSFAVTPQTQPDVYVMPHPNPIYTPRAELEEIVVTAARTPTKLNNTIAQTTVVDKAALQHYQGQSAFDVISRQPGVSYYSNGGLGTKANFYMRGYDGKQILVLIDGVRYSSVSDGGAALQLLPADQIDRIEILQGASGSSIYGADAMGGVIQIFTKGQDIEQSQISVTAGVGSHNQYLYGASAQLRNNSGTALSLSASHNETDGINATLPNPSNPFSPYNKDKDGFESDNYSLSLTQKVNDALLVGASGLYSESTSQFDKGPSQGDDNTRSEQKNGAAQAFVDWRYAPSSSVKLSYGQSQDKSYNYGYNSLYDSEQQQISLVGRHQLPVGQAVFGAEHLKQSLDSTAYKVDDRKVTSGFAGYVLGSDSFDAQANVRYDDFSEYGSQTTYNLGGAYHITPGFRVGANYAKGFRAPSFNELFGYGGNPKLNPETSDNYEVFAELNSLNNITRVTGYKNDVKDLITYVYEPTTDNPYAGSIENVDRAKIKGITLTSDWFIENYLLGFSYDYMQAKDEGDYTGRVDDSGNPIDYNGNFLAIRPEHKGLAYIGYQWPSFDIRAEYQYVGDYYYNLNNDDSQLVKSHGLVNISGNYQLTPKLSMTARLNNLTNKEYVSAPGYNTEGTNFFTSLTYNFY
ncbi:MAG: TonB-dependent receptor [Psychrobacter sp.]|nr:TonB-dependent receptor [Psychrobacter sp.]